jgi:hypothetical protein
MPERWASALGLKTGATGHGRRLEPTSRQGWLRQDGPQYPGEAIESEGLVEDRDIAKALRDDFADIPCREKERDASRAHEIGNGVDGILADPDVEHCGIEFFLPSKMHCLIERCCRTDDLATEIKHHVLDHHADRSLVFDHEDAPTVFNVHATPDSSGWKPLRLLMETQTRRFSTWGVAPISYLAVKTPEKSSPYDSLGADISASSASIFDVDTDRDCADAAPDILAA